ncbi:MAG: class I SAM-dependent methyltransferase [Bdellovibrionales bacterium]|nr:class I SAM-dependent methyltransferase [Bdellovibrionales bacterium]
MKPPSLLNVLFFLRNLMSRKIFAVIGDQARGDILDVGGWDFYLYVRSHLKDFNTYTAFDLPSAPMLDVSDEKYRRVLGDGCHMTFPDNSFDTVINVQVLEHVFEPHLMFSEICRVLKPGGRAIFVVPQTANLHMAPHHFYNFTRYWLEEACARNQVKIVDYSGLGGWWVTFASRSFYFLLQASKAEGRFDGRNKRGLLFYILLPLMILFNCFNVVLGLFLSIGDLPEEAPNHLLVIQK